MTIKKLLNGTGIKIFIKYFEDFSNDSLQVNDLIEILPNEYTEKSRRSRTGKARTIIKNHLTIKYLILSSVLVHFLPFFLICLSSSNIFVSVLLLIFLR